MEFALYRCLSKALAMIDKEHIPIRRHGIRHVETYDVTEDELDQIEREGSDLGIDFQVAQISLTLALSFLANVLLTPVPVGKIYTIFIVIIVVGFLFGLTHLYKWYQHRGAFSCTIQKIRDRQVGPIGEEGRELKPSDLAELKSVESPPTSPTESQE